MHHPVAMGFGQSQRRSAARWHAASASGNRPRPRRAASVSPSRNSMVRKSISPLGGGRGVDLENLAHIGMADFAGVAHFRRQALAESALGALERDAAAQLFVLRPRRRCPCRPAPLRARSGSGPPADLRAETDARATPETAAPAGNPACDGPTARSPTPGVNNSVSPAQAVRT